MEYFGTCRLEKSAKKLLLSPDRAAKTNCGAEGEGQKKKRGEGRGLRGPQSARSRGGGRERSEVKNGRATCPALDQMTYRS